MNANLVEIQNQEELNWIQSKSNSLSLFLSLSLSLSLSLDRPKSMLLFEMQIDRISKFSIYRYEWLVVEIFASFHDFLWRGGAL